MGYGDLKGFKNLFGFGGVAPGLCSGLRAIPSEDGRSVSLKWTDPENSVIDNVLLASWKKTTIVRKKGSYPTSLIDGKIILETTVKNQYSANAYIDEDFSESESASEFYYMAFPESDTGAISINEGNHFRDKIIYGIKISRSNSDPAGRVEYLEDCAGFTPAKMNFATGIFDYGSWEGAFFMPRPCMLNYDGTVAYYLDPNDYAMKADGGASEITSSAFEGNVMIEFPTVWIYTTTDGVDDYIYISDTKVNENYEAYAHHDQNGAIMPYTYMPAYNGSLISSKIRSLSGQSCMNTQTGTNEITYAKNNGAPWNTEVLADRMLVNALLLLIGKSTNTQAVFGNGHYTGGSQASNLLKTGTMDGKGLFWGTNGTGSGVKVFGMENWWGNQWRRIAGYINNNGTQKIKMTYGTEDGSSVTGYNTDGTGYLTLSGSTPAGTSGGYINEMVTNKFGRFPKTASGSETTFEADGLWFNNGQIDYAYVGGCCSYGFHGGAFAVYLRNLVSNSAWNVGASLSCKPTV